MFKFLPGKFRGVVSYVMIFFSTLFLCFPLYFFALIRLVGPAGIESWCNKRIMHVADFWIDCNNFIIDLFQSLEITVTGLDDLSLDNWYLVLCNHQSWTDILILQRVFNRRIPFLKFFIKQQLIYVPFIGIAWWALDFPIMKRYSREFLLRHPELKGKDLETTRRSCERFKHSPVSVLNFLEGTRFTPEKKAKQASAYQHLLTPKGGGAAMVIDSLGDRMERVLDVTIFYPDGVPGFFDFFCGKTSKIIFHVEQLPIPDLYSATTRISMRSWINEIWTDKDKRLQALR